MIFRGVVSAALLALAAAVFSLPSVAQGYGAGRTEDWRYDDRRYGDWDRWDGPRRTRPPAENYDPYDARDGDANDDNTETEYQDRGFDRRYEPRRYDDDREQREYSRAERDYQYRRYDEPRAAPRPRSRPWPEDEARDMQSRNADDGARRRDTAREPQGADEQGKVAGVSGGERPFIAPEAPPHVAFSGGYMPGSIVIDTGARKLYYVTGPTSALAYPIGVGREGFSWTGHEKISRVADWPDWYPPAEMRKRKPELPERMLGGIRNPLGAKAMYLGNTLYRIHGTNDPKSIGKAESSGCFRMLNAQVLHLATLAHIGTEVWVVNSVRLPKVAAKPVPKPRPVVERLRPHYGDRQYRSDWRWREGREDDPRAYR